MLQRLCRYRSFLDKILLAIDRPVNYITLMVNEQTTQQRIIDSAFELMYAQSYAEVGVAAICEKADVKKGSFYHFYKSKQELAIAVLEAKFWEYKESILDTTFTGKLSPLDEIALFAEKIYQFQADVKAATGNVLGCPFGNIALELSSQDEAIRSKIEHIFTRSMDSLRGCLQRGVDNKDAQLSGIDVSATADAMYAYLEGIILFAKAQNNTDVIRQLSPAMLNIRIYPNPNPNPN